MTAGARRVTSLLLLIAAAAAGCGDDATARAGAPASDEARARTAVAAFLDRYVDADGRVVRRDQGGDTVSEGQGYALLLTAATGDEAAFDRVWTWTRSHLQRGDGLLSWLWRSGRVADRQPASDADLDAAHALLLAADRFERSDLRREGARIAGAVLDHETVSDGAQRLLVAGPWAVARRVVNPSYFSPRAYAVLASTGRAAAWRQLHDQAVAALGELRTGLPPEWATAAGGVRALSSPDGSSTAAPEYGFGAARVGVRMGSACDQASRAAVARLWPALSGADAALLPRHLDGTAGRGAVGHPVALVGAAGAARAAGREADMKRLLDAAAAQDRAAPTYYGAAWVALGRVLLTTDLAGRCPGS